MLPVLFRESVILLFTLIIVYFYNQLFTPILLVGRISVIFCSISVTRPPPPQCLNAAIRGKFPNRVVYFFILNTNIYCIKLHVESQYEFSEMDIYKCPIMIYRIYFFLEENEFFPYAVKSSKMKNNK